MKLLILSFLSLYVFGVCQTTSGSNSEKAFATIKNGAFVIKIDTVAYKKKVKEALFNDPHIVFNKITINRQNTLNTKREFYYVMLSTKDNRIRVAKWLNKKGNNLFSNDEITEGDLFEQTYLICDGDGTCSPQVYEDGTKKLWGCSEDIKCYIGDKVNSDCTASKSIID